MRDLFLLDPDITFLNHGSFGATPQLVFAAYQAWQRRLEWQPVQFLINDIFDYLQDARTALGKQINAASDDIVYIPNATFGLNVVARSLDLEPGDVVLTTDHEYGACENVWQFLSNKRGFQIIKQPIPLPVTSAQAIVDQFWQAVTPQTKVIFISHITSSTALTLPVAMICKRARSAGILTIIDGSHALGQIPLDMTALDADFYFSNAHKWLCAPKGAAFLYTRQDKQALIEPLVVGWGWGEDRTFTFGSDYLDYMQWLGTNDLSAYLSVPTAIQFQHDHDWTAVRQACHKLVRQAQQRICEITGLTPIYPDNSGFYHQMASIPLPLINDLAALKYSLLNDYRIEIPLVEWNGRHFIRISVQAYNTQADIDRLVLALQELIPRFSKLS